MQIINSNLPQHEQHKYEGVQVGYDIWWSKRNGIEANFQFWCGIFDAWLAISLFSY